MFVNSMHRVTDTVSMWKRADMYIQGVLTVTVSTNIFQITMSGQQEIPDAIDQFLNGKIGCNSKHFEDVPFS